MLKDKKLDAKEARRLAELNKIDEDVLTEMRIRDLIKETVGKGCFSVRLHYPLSERISSSLIEDGYFVEYDRVPISFGMTGILRESHTIISW